MSSQFVHHISNSTPWTSMGKRVIEESQDLKSCAAQEMVRFLQKLWVAHAQTPILPYVSIHPMCLKPKKVSKIMTLLWKRKKKKKELGKKSKINFTCGGMECKKNRLVVIGGVGTGVFGWWKFWNRWNNYTNFEFIHY